MFEAAGLKHVDAWKARARPGFSCRGFGPRCGVSKNGQRVRLRVEHIVVQWNGGVVGKKQIKVFERLGGCARQTRTQKRERSGKPSQSSP